jgi:transposase
MDQDALCSCCKLPYDVLPQTEDSEVLEVINVRAYRRVIHRKMYKRGCQCIDNPDPQIITAPPMERLLPKSKIGVSIWAYMLLNKYAYQHPLYRGLAQLNGYGLALAMGTVTDGLQKLLPLLIPVYDLMIKRSVNASHWHADETGWKVFEATEEKKNSRWYLWVFHNAETVVYKIAPSRSSKVLLQHFGDKPSGGTLNVDRYSAYKVIAKSGLFILAFCWAHVRRDFLNYSKTHKAQEAWGLKWVDAINGLYHLNNQRIEHEQSSLEFRQYDKALKEALDILQKTAAVELIDQNVLPSAKKLLTSLNRHWAGLTVFVEHPQIPMDNNQAERSLRNSVIGRKNYYGSGSVWSSELAAALFTIFETLKLWKINLHTWLLAYLQECAMSGGKPPSSIKSFLPWEMTPIQMELFSKPPKYENSA